MLFLIFSLSLIAICLFYFYQKHKNSVKRGCSYGCVKAYDLLQQPNEYEALRVQFSTLSTPAERYFYSVSMSRLMSLEALKRWTEDFQESGDALLCYGARLLQWSWSARGYGRGYEISEANWAEFFRRLEMTREVLLECAERSPDDPTPWSYLIMVATWHSDATETKYHYFNEAIARDPENWSAHMHMIIALSQKWGGSHDEMLQFARNASKNASDGSDLKVILVKAYIEYWKFLAAFEGKPEEAERFISDAKVREDILELYKDSIFHENFVESKVTIFARYNLSGWFWIVQDKAHLKAELMHLGNKLEDIHWRWVGTEGQLADAWQFVEN